MTKESSGWLRALSRVSGAITHCLDFACWLGVRAASIVAFLAVIMIVTEVIIRYGRLSNVTFADELSGYAFAFLCTIAAADALRGGDFLQVTFIFKRFNQRLQNILMVLSYIAGLLVVGMLTVQFWGYFMESVEIKARSVSVLRVPVYIPQFFVVIGLALLFLQLIRVMLSEILKVIQHRKEGQKNIVSL
jgi:TRAP-type C4-dicarboxylate transport system permease small subunit